MISVTTSNQSAELVLKILNIAGMGHAFYGESNGIGSKNLWIIPKSKKNKQEIIAQLQDEPAIQSVSVVALSKPVEATELTKVRKLFAGVGWDSGNVTNDELSLFINTKLQGQHTYYIDFDPKQKREGPVTIRIKPVQDHPHFSPDWLKENDYTGKELPDRELTMNDLEIQSVVVRSVEEELPPPPPTATN